MKRLFLTQKAGIDVDASELYTVKSTPSQIMQLKHEDTLNADEAAEAPRAAKFEFGNLSTTTVNSLIPGAADKAYCLTDGTKVVSTRKNAPRKRNRETVIMDVTEDKPDVAAPETPAAAESESESESADPDPGPPRKRRRTNALLKRRSTRQLQSFLECASDDDVLALEAQSRVRRFSVQVSRRAHIAESRMQLPIVGEEHRIMEAVRAHDVVLVCGETGSGKSTQVP